MPGHRWRERHRGRAVNPGRDRLDLGFKRGLISIDILMSPRSLLRHLGHGPGQRFRPGPALGPVPGDHGLNAQRFTALQQALDLGLRVAGKVIQAYHAGQAIDLSDVFDMASQVGHAFFQGRQVFPLELGARDAAMIFQRAHGRHQRHHGRLQAGHAGLDIDELLRAQVRAKARLGHDIIGQLQPGPGGGHAVAAVGDVGKGAAMNDGQIILQGLRQIRLDGVFQERGQRASGLEVARIDRRLVIALVADDDAPEALFQIGAARGQTEDRHDLGGHDNIEAVFARKTIGRPAEARRDPAQGAIVHVHHALPLDPPGINPGRVAVVDMVVDHGREQVMRDPDSVEIAGKMQVDVLHGHDLGIAAARRAALDPETGAERGLAQARDGLFAEPIQRVGEAHGGGGLALAGGGRADRGHEDQPAVRFILQAVDVVQRELGLVVSVRREVLRGNPVLIPGQVNHGPHGRLARDFDIRHFILRFWFKERGFSPRRHCSASRSFWPVHGRPKPAS